MSLRRAAGAVCRSVGERHRGKAAGFILGWAAGAFGAAIGFVIGCMIDVLLSRRETEKAVAAYFADPGPSAFPERIAGSAAFCALCVLVARGSRRREDEAIPLARAERTAAALFGASGDARAELESYARAAEARVDSLNPDLLAESFCARAGKGSAGKALREAARAALERLAEGEAARELADRIGRTMDPEGSRAADAAAAEPYALLGLRPGASLKETKAAYRRLAVQLHPDAAAGLSEEQRKSAAEAFMRVDAAYRSIAGKRSAQQPSERSMRAPRAERRETRDS